MATRKKVLVLTSTFPRWKNDTDPKFVYELSKRLQTKHDIHILAPHAENTQNYEVIDDMHVFRYRYFFSRFEKLAYDGGMLPNIKKKPALALLIPFFLLGQMYAIWKLNRKSHYDIIHAHWIVPQGLCLYLLSLFSRQNTKIIVTSHGGDLFSLKGFLFEKLKIKILRQAAHITVVSKVMKERVESWGIHSNKISVAPMGVDLQNTFIPPPETTQRKGLIFVGRLVEKKGVKYLIQAMPLILKIHPEEKLTIIGDGPLKGELQSLARDLNVSDNVIFKGAIPNDEITRYLQQSYIAIVPSIVTASGDQEGLGLTIVEAMGCECLVIASDLDAIRDVVMDRKTGFLVPAQDPQVLAQTISEMLDDKNKYSQVSKDGRVSCCQKFDWSNVVQNYNLVYADKM